MITLVFKFLYLDNLINTRFLYLLPPSAFWSSFVRTESLYGTITFFFPIDKSANA